MKVFTFFYNRFTTASTSIALKKNGIDHYVMIHSEDDLEKFKKGNVLKGTPVVTNCEKGLAYQRNKALDMMEEGEWAAFLCDDFKRILSIPITKILSKKHKLKIDFSNQKEYRLKLKDEISLKEMFSMFPTLIKLAEQNKIDLIGFALHDNPMNLQNKFTTKGLADGRFWLVKKSNYKFDVKAQLIDDVAWTAENLIQRGKVLVLNWTVPYFERYSAGGFGSTEERKNQRKKECLYLVNKYFPLVRFADKKGWDYGTHIKIFGSHKNIFKTKNRT